MHLLGDAAARVEQAAQQMLHPVAAARQLLAGESRVIVSRKPHSWGIEYQWIHLVSEDLVTIFLPESLKSGMMKLLIHHITVVSPDLEIDGGWLLVENGRIVAVAGPDEALPEADLVIDGGGRIAMPGFFDIHSHGAAGDDVCDPDPRSVRRIAERKLREGVTTWLPTTLTQPEETLREIAANCAAYMAAPDYLPHPRPACRGAFHQPGKRRSPEPGIRPTAGFQRT